jgi:hypothetical protein
MHPTATNLPVVAHSRPNTSIPLPVTAATAFYSVPVVAASTTGKWPKESDSERKAWANSAIGPVRQVLRKVAEKPSYVEAFIGAKRGTRTVGWRTWDDDAGTWERDFDGAPGDVWEQAQDAFDRHIDTDKSDIIRIGLECLQIAGRFALASYPVEPNGHARYTPVDTFGQPLTPPDDITAAVQTALRGSNPTGLTKAVEALNQWCLANDKGLWKTRAVRIASVSEHRPEAKRKDQPWAVTTYELAVDDQSLKLASWSFLTLVTRDSAGGASADPGWVNTALAEIEAYVAACKAVVASLNSQILAPFVMVPSEATPMNRDDLSEALFGPGLIDGKKTDDDLVSTGSYVGAMMALGAKAAVEQGKIGATVSPTLLDIDGAFIEAIRVLDIGRKLDPEIVATWQASLKVLVDASEAAADAFFGAGAASGFNRNIGTVTAENEAADAGRAAQWIMDRVCESLVAPYFRSSGTVEISDWRQVRICVDASVLSPPPVLSARDVQGLFTAGVLSQAGALKVLRLPSDVGADPEDIPLDAGAPDAPEPAEPPTIEPAADPLGLIDLAPVTAAATVGDDLAQTLVDIQAELVAYMRGQTDAALDRAAVRLGSILRSNEKDPARKTLVAGIGNRDVVDVLGADRVRAILAKLDPSEEDSERRLFDEALVALVAAWGVAAKKAWGKIRAAFVAAGIFATIEETETVLSKARENDLVDASGTVLRASVLDVFRRKLLDPAAAEVEAPVVERMKDGEPSLVEAGAAVAIAVAALSGDPVIPGSDAGATAGGMTAGPEIETLLEGTPTGPTARITGYWWDYGTAARQAPAWWHVENAAKGVVEELSEFKGFPNDHHNCKCGAVRPVIEMV